MYILTLRWPRGSLPTGFSSFSQDWNKPSDQTKLLAVVSSLGHLLIKHFLDHTVLALKLDKGRGALGGVATTPMDFSLPISLTMKMTINLDEFWYKLR